MRPASAPLRHPLRKAPGGSSIAPIYRGCMRRSVGSRGLPSPALDSPARRARRDEPYLAQLQQSASSVVEARVADLARQTRDFVDATYCGTSDEAICEAPRRKPRPVTCVPGLRRKLEASRELSSIVKHPTRLLAQQLQSALETHISGRPNQTSDFQMALLDQTDDHHAFFHKLVEALASHLEMQPASVGAGAFLRQFWTVYVDGLYEHVVHAKRLGLVFYENAADATLHPARRPIETDAMMIPEASPKLRASKATAGLLCERPPSAIPQSLSPSQDGPELTALKRLLTAKASTLRVELVSMQRLRESIFSSVLNAQAMQRTDKDKRARLHLSQQMDQHASLVQRYAEASPRVVAAATLIQRILRRKLAIKHCHLLRLLDLMKVKSQTLFEKSCSQMRGTLALASAPSLDVHALDAHFTSIVWEVQRLVRDLSLDWWKQSLSEERARLAWELADVSDDLKHVTSLVSILLQNCTNCMAHCTTPPTTCVALRVASTIVDRVDQAPLDQITHMNLAIEDCINALRPTKPATARTIAIQTEEGHDRHPSYLEALSKLAALYEALPDSDSDDDEPIVAYGSAVFLSLVPPANDVATPSADVLSVAPNVCRVKLSDTKRPKRRRYLASNTLANIPKAFAPIFKLLGVTRGYKARPLSLPKLKLLLHDLYSSRMHIEEYTRPLPEFIYQFFLRKYGLRKVAEAHVVDLMASLKKFWRHDPEVHLFARFCSLKNTLPLSIDAFDYFICLLGHLQAGDSQQAEPVVPYSRVQGLHRHAVASVSLFEPQRMLELVNFQPDMLLMRLEGHINDQPDVINGKRLGVSAAHIYIDRHALLALYVSEFEAIERHVELYLKEVFENADIDHNGELTLDEFNSIVQKIEPTPMWEAQRMFFEAVALTGNALADAVTADAFILVAKKQGLGARSFPDTRRHALTAPIALDHGLLASYHARNAE
ncbi:hypothetical protein SPRG_22336 [Saprolegnia parasitica CBS 223.65]|uniref:EF-hand domain-containing protein n=1 Tax=Saprolegnia parasitica (strain CBS 223.65) TaxID=695850 RepID=A0A067BW18_SAPPC|nr:hypothetical protein SPRG_22336 [Saprolegnia parasitica CBS 223.65]KDO21045.1 hypothetical protein SPRG_22336 [Saprolegnia parasitica CBS 223.65]|eukprot:XP_012208254.1 hypothetical protein SPRG_22336 [Saprolegnia parasitica CBS 223.65]